MQNALRHGAFRYLAAVSIAAGVGALRPGPRLLQIPEGLVSELVDAVSENEPSWPEADRRRVLMLLGSDPRSAVRARVAEASATLVPNWPDDASRLLSGLALDPSPEVRDAAARGFEMLLARTTPIDRVELVCRWACSEQAPQREALARALCSSVPTLVTDLVIDELSRDASAGVRLSAVRAAKQRFDENPELYAAVLRDRESDRNRRVRREAQRARAELA